MLKKFLLLTAATVSIYASLPEEHNQSNRNTSVAVTVRDNQDVRNMEEFKTHMTNLVNNLMSNLSSEKESLMSKVTTLSAELTTSKSDLGKKTEELAALQQKFDTASNDAKAIMAGELASLQKKITDAEADKENLQSVCEAIKKQLNDTHKTISSNEEAMQKLQQQLDEAKLGNEKLTTENASKAIEIAQLQADIRTKQNALTSAETNVANKTVELERVQNELEAAKKNGAKLNAEQQQQLEAAQRDLDSAKALADKAETQLAVLRAERDQAVADLDLANGKLQPYQNFMNLHNATFPTVDKQGNIMERSRFHRTPSGIWSDATDELPKVRQQLEDLQKQHAELQKKLAADSDVSAVVAQLKEEVANNQKNLVDMQQNYDNMKNDSLGLLEDAKDKVSSLSEQLQAEQEANRYAQAQLAKISAAMKIMETKAAGNTDLVSQLQKQTAELNMAQELAEQKSQQSVKSLEDADAQRQKTSKQNQLDRKKFLDESRKAQAAARAELEAKTKAEQEEVARLAAQEKAAGRVELDLQRKADLANREVQSASDKANFEAKKAEILSGANGAMAKKQVIIDLDAARNLETMTKAGITSISVSNMKRLLNDQSHGLSELLKAVDGDAHPNLLLKRIQRLALEMSAIKSQRLDPADVAKLDINGLVGLLTNNLGKLSISERSMLVSKVLESENVDKK